MTLPDIDIYNSRCAVNHYYASLSQSTLRPPEVHMFYRKIELRIVCMGDNDMHAACTHEQKMVDYVIPELQDKGSDRYN